MPSEDCAYCTTGFSLAQCTCATKCAAVYCGASKSRLKDPRHWI